MRKFISVTVSIAFLLLSSSCQNDNDSPGGISPTDIEINLKSKEIIEADNQFGTDLFKTIIEEENNIKNLMISPLSVSVALAMVYNGAEGDTKTQMEQMLHKYGLTPEEINQSYYDLIEALESHDPKVKFSIANSIFSNDDFTIFDEFLQTNHTYYDAETQSLDFSNTSNTLETVNNWVKNKTNNKIEKILENVSPNDALYLINAIYFNADWTYQFDKNNTQDLPFFQEDETELSVPTMIIEETFNYSNQPKFQILELPYGGEKYSMLILLPNEGYSANEVANSISCENLANWTSNMDKTDKVVLLPKFEFAYENSLSDNLKYLGMEDAFSPVKANFSLITDEPIYISTIKHKSYIKVDEEGTEAAAVTGTTFKVRENDPEIFNVDHPFVFTIREKDTNSILFIGKVSNPLNNGE